VAPYGLVFHAGRWYLAAHDDRSDEVRTFRVDRVRSAEARPERATVPKGFDAVTTSPARSRARRGDGRSRSCSRPRWRRRGSGSRERSEIRRRPKAVWSFELSRTISTPRRGCWPRSGGHSPSDVHPSSEPRSGTWLRSLLRALPMKAASPEMRKAGLRRAFAERPKTLRPGERSRPGGPFAPGSRRTAPAGSRRGCGSRRR